MSFANFTNPYQNLSDVPGEYRKHPNLSKLLKADGFYVRYVRMILGEEEIGEN